MPLIEVPALPEHCISKHGVSIVNLQPQSRQNQIDHWLNHLLTTEALPPETPVYLEVTDNIDLGVTTFTFGLLA